MCVDRHNDDDDKSDMWSRVAAGTAHRDATRGQKWQ